MLGVLTIKHISKTEIKLFRVAQYYLRRAWLTDNLVNSFNLDQKY